jgi:hypothetical protein
MPTFVFLKNGTKLDTMKGADPNALEEKIKKWYGSGDEDEEEPAVKGYVRWLPVYLVLRTHHACIFSWICHL